MFYNLSKFDANVFYEKGRIRLLQIKPMDNPLTIDALKELKPVHINTYNDPHPVRFPTFLVGYKDGQPELSKEEIADIKQEGRYNTSIRRFSKIIEKYKTKDGVKLNSVCYWIRFNEEDKKAGLNFPEARELSYTRDDSLFKFEITKGPDDEEKYNVPNCNDPIKAYRFVCLWESFLVQTEHLEKAIPAIEERLNLKGRLSKSCTIFPWVEDRYSTEDAVIPFTHSIGKMTVDEIISLFGCDKKSGSKIDIFSDAFVRLPECNAGEKFLISLDRKTLPNSLPPDFVFARAGRMKILGSSSKNDGLQLVVETTSAVNQQFVNGLFGALENLGSNNSINVSAVSFETLESSIENLRKKIGEQNAD